MPHSYRTFSRVAPLALTLALASVAPMSPLSAQTTAGAQPLSPALASLDLHRVVPVPTSVSAAPGAPFVFGANTMVVTDGPDEGYRLDISADTIRIVSPTPAGVFYGVATLRQLLPWGIEAEHSALRLAPTVSVPAGRIVDTPRFAWRGSMLDVARHFFTVDEVKLHLDLMALYKFNRLHLHLTDDQGWRIATIVRRYGKSMVGWEEVGNATLRPGSIAQLWRSDTALLAVKQGNQLIMSPGPRTYLDMNYTPTTEVVLKWAGYIALRTAYDWDPATHSVGLSESSILGVEAPL